MSDIAYRQPSGLKTLQQRISIATWVITLLLSLRGLLAFYGMKDKGSIEQIITFITDPIVGLLHFARIENLEIPGISVLFAAISILLLSQIVQFSLWSAEQRRIRAQKFVYQHTLRSNKQT